MSDSTSIVVGGHGGPRKHSGPKPSWFKEEMGDLLRRCSPKIIEFAESVFNNEAIEPRVTKQGVIFTHASVHDKTVLLCSLAKLAGFVGEDTSPLREPLQKVIDQVQAIKLMQELNYGAHGRADGNSNSPVVGNGHPPPHAEGPAA